MNFHNNLYAIIFFKPKNKKIDPWVKSGRKKFRPLYVLNTFDGSPPAKTIVIAVISSLSSRPNLLFAVL